MSTTDTSYAAHNYADAKARWAAARTRLETATTGSAKRLASEDVEFYGNRMAYLGAWLRSAESKPGA